MNQSIMTLFVANFLTTQSSMKMVKILWLLTTLFPVAVWGKERGRQVPDNEMYTRQRVLDREVGTIKYCVFQESENISDI
jgi:hypothetical protein